MQRNIKGTVEENMHTHRDTKIGPRPRQNPLWEKNLANILLLRSSSNDAAKDSIVIRNFIYPEKQ